MEKRSKHERTGLMAAFAAIVSASVAAVAYNKATTAGCWTTELQ